MMEKGTQGKILFLVLIASYAAGSLLDRSLSQNLNYVLSAIRIVLTLYFIYWLGKNTDFFKFKGSSAASTATHRMDILEQMGFYQIMIPAGIILGIFALGLGFCCLLLGGPDAKDGFAAMLMLGLGVIAVMLFVKHSIKK